MILLTSALSQGKCSEFVQRSAWRGGEADSSAGRSGNAPLRAHHLVLAQRERNRILADGQSNWGDLNHEVEIKTAPEMAECVCPGLCLTAPTGPADGCRLPPVFPQPG